MAIETGTLLHGRYRIVENLAQGGMGSIYNAMDETLGILVAVKENLFTTDEAARQFRLEAIILANLRHPNLPRVTDHFTVEGWGQYLVMDYIEGEDLRERMERLGVIPEDDVITIGAAICDALSYLHTRTPTILHRDIKPGNVKIAPNGHIVLLDFGLAKVMQGDQATTVGARAMTPGYSPPEQYGTARTDPRSDIYSLGATLYAAAAGVIPEDGLARAMENAQLSPLRKRNPGTSRKFALAIEKAMAVDPADRFQTADEFKQALLSARSRTMQPVGAYTVTPPPIVAAEAATQEPLGKNGKLLPEASGQEGHAPFVSPRKRLGIKAKRVRRLIIAALVIIVAGGYFAVDRLSPGLIPMGMQGLFLAASRTDVAAAVQATFTASPTRGITPSPAPRATSTMPAEVLVPTPPGSESQEIAFASTRTGLPQIYIANLHGEVRQVTEMPEGACQPAWSPDGKQMVFVSPCKVQQDVYRGSSLYLLNADGTGLLPLNTMPGGDFEPDWSPDGRFIAFTSVRTGHMQIYSYDLRSGITTRLIRTLRATDARQPAWSPDGAQIAFAFRRSGNAYEIWLMSNIGKNQQQLVRSGDQLADFQPEWAPDGKLILFSQAPVDKFGFPRLAMLQMEEADAEPVVLNMNVLSISNVDYSQDGFWLAFESMGDHGTNVYYMTVTGAQKTALVPDFAEDFDPAWRPMPKP